jgi:Zn-dependent protease with chaperone function
MNRGTAGGVTVIFGALCLLAAALHTVALLPPVLTGGIIVVCFPPFVLFLGLWWRAGEKEADLPFVGW